MFQEKHLHLFFPYAFFNISLKCAKKCILTILYNNVRIMLYKYNYKQKQILQEARKMFKELEKMNNGRTTTKILATLLVLTLTFSNLAIIGSYIGKAFTSYAISDTSTNVPNVKCEFYVENEGQRETSADIGNEELKIGVSVEVEI